jgi:hypothetical protein
VIKDPVIVLGAPRSATTLLFKTLSAHSGLWSLRSESHRVFEGPYHPSRTGKWHHALGAEDLTPENARALRAAFLERAMPGTVRRLQEEGVPGGKPGYASARVRAMLVRRILPVRLLEKTPRNCLRIPFLRALFPDAKFLFLRRDGLATISSLIEGWNAAAGSEGRDVPLPEPLRIPGYAGKSWCYVLPPGWRALADQPLEVVCAEQWKACVEAILAELPSLRAEGRVCELSYEELTLDPRPTLLRILSFLGLPPEESVVPSEGLLPVVNARTPPDPQKWRKRNGEMVERIIPRVAAVQKALGYGS